MVKRNDNYERAETTFSKTNELEMDIFKHLMEMAKVIGKGSYIKQLLYEDMLKKREVKWSLYFFYLKLGNLINNRKLSAILAYDIGIGNKKEMLLLLRTTVSYKKTTRDVKLFSEVENKEKNEKSEFVKDALEFYIKYLEGLKKL